MKTLHSAFALGLFTILAVHSARAEERTFHTGCVNNDGASSLEALTINGARYTTSGVLFAGEDCTNPIMGMEGETELVRLGAPYGEGVEADFKIISMRISPQSEEYAAAFNGSSFCGYNDWTVGVAKEITGRSCEGELTPNSGTVVPAILKDEGTTIRIGTSDDHVTRPTVLDPEVYNQVP